VSVRLVWDTSTLLAYVSGDIRAVELGELLAAVLEGGDVTGIPALCLIAAYNGSDGEQRAKLIELTGDDDGPAVILPVLAADVAPIAEFTDKLPYDLAHAAYAGLRQDALLGTYERARYAGSVSEDDILDL
jgi:hypothetical protein